MEMTEQAPTIHPFAERNIFYCPLLVLKGIAHYGFLFFPRGLKQMEVFMP